jgi:hypothetical protein
MTTDEGFYSFYHRDDPLPPEICVQNGPVSVHATPAASKELLSAMGYLLYLTTSEDMQNKRPMNEIRGCMEVLAPFWERALDYPEAEW